MSRILIVDDHPVIRMAMKMLLEAEGHQIVGDTDNGVDAISLGRELKPDWSSSISAFPGWTASRSSAA